ncbi:MAG: AsmA-like C-terminal domain-containing protein [Sulfurimonas sp.]|uniref:YhdP family protein n=1 Tax=Sulfurimonas sp. TaxID=2022749 RepID=UPI0026067D2A|nr:AsmA-like C-terminal domain-containing protein [Sulfurimonas sp.]MDD5372191.1 AsmA-like C-terminal domain-containing protein [Sulfurimonas sp.]
MNDNIIISAISKIQFILVSIFSFIFLILFASFMLLQNGIYIDNISFQTVKVEKLYIKWDEKISVVAKELNFTKEKKRSDSEIEYEKIIKIVKNTLPFTVWFKEIIIEKISLGDTDCVIRYTDDEKGLLHISSPDFILNSSLFSYNNLITLKIDELKAIKKDLKIDGNISFDIKDKLKFTTTLNITVHNDTKLNLFAHGDAKKLSYKVESNENIKDTRQIVDLFDVHPDVKYWIYDAIEMSSLSLNELYGWLEYENLDKAYLNLYAKAVANDLKYTYDKKVDSVRTAKTDLEFKEGVLYIKPQNAYSYNFFLDKSWLKIDFSKKEELLTLYLLFKGKVNKELLSLLDRYKIKLPFVQNRGEVDTNLTLDINLITLSVNAVGDFYAKEAQINYLGLDIDIFDAHVFLNNYDVKVNNMIAKYSDIAASHVDLDFNAKESEGKLTFKFDNIDSKENKLTLLKNKEPFVATYSISPKQDYLTIDKSIWRFYEQTLYVDTMKIPFDIKELSATIPQTLIEVPNLLSAVVAGDIFFNSKKADLDIDLLKFNYIDISLDKSIPSFSLAYDTNKLTLSSKNDIKLKIEEKKLTLENLTADIMPEAVQVKNLSLNFENILKSKISTEYNLANSKGVINLQNLEFKNDSFGEILKTDENIRFLVENENNKTSISSKELDFKYLFSDNEWKVTLNSIDKITKYSNILKEYGITNGNLTLHKKNDEDSIKFLLNTDHKYKILATKNKPVESYAVNGEFNGKTKETSFKVNDLIAVEIKKDIKIKADSIGINLDEILNFSADRNSTHETKNSSDIYFEAKNSYIRLSENRHIVSDTISFKYVDEDLHAELTHKNGKAFLKLRDDILHLYGENFDDEFMGELFALSKFKGGSLEFYISGSTKEYNGVLYVKDTTILDYKILNNILAFVNTVPSLVTFSLPGYNQNGIAAKNAYLNFKFKDDIYKIINLHLKSKEIEIVGVGEASIKNNAINMDLNLKTGLGSSISKIPLIGHILLGKENLSTTLTVSGTLDNPDVNTQITKDIAAAPFNIIKRALMYPFQLFDGEEEKEEKK